MTAGKTLHLPNDPILKELLLAAQRASPSYVFIHDVLGFDKSYEQLLGDIESMRLVLLSHLTLPSNDHRSSMHNIAVLTRSAYETSVAFFCCRAIGAVFIPLGRS